MRRTEILSAVEEVNQALNETKLQELFRSYIRNRGKESDDIPQRLLNSLKQYSIRAHVYSPAAKRIAEILELRQLENTSVWTIIATSNPHPIINELFSAVRFAIDYLPKLATLIKQEPLDLIIQTGEKQSRFKDKEILSVIIIEEETRFSSPARLAEVLEGVSEIYEACAILLDYSPNELSVIACDSGSDKSFDFLGAAKVIECVKEIFFSLWDRIVFFRERKLSQRIELVAGALPVIEKIGNLEQENKLGREQAEILRRKILGGVGKFIEAGAIIPEIEDRTYFNPRSLMAPEPKLLVSASIDSKLEENTLEESDDTEQHKTDEDSSDIRIENLDANERADLLRLLEKAKRKENEDSQIADERLEGWSDESIET